MSNIVTVDTNLVIGGDFNLHVNDVDDPNANIFLDMMSAFGFSEHVVFDTHKAGNILDLLFTEEISQISLLECNPGPILSDHTAVEFTLSVKRQDIERKEANLRKLDKIDIGVLFDSCDFDSLTSIDVNDLVNEFDVKLRSAVDEAAPLETKFQTVRKRYPWFTGDVKQQKKIVRSRERAWRKYHNDETWLALKSERTKYKRQLYHLKR